MMLKKLLHNKVWLRFYLSNLFIIFLCLSAITASERTNLSLPYLWYLAFRATDQMRYFMYAITIVLGALLYKLRPRQKEKQLRHQRLLTFLTIAIAIGVFIYLKLPYFSLTFTGGYYPKYAAYVEPALYMREKHTPFLLQRKYIADPITNPQGIFPYFTHLPLLEWALYGSYFFMPNNSLEINTRLVMSTVGIAIMLAAYVILTKLSTRTHAVLAVALLALHPVFQLSTYLTVLDSWTLLFALLSFILLVRYTDLHRTQDLIYSGLVLGIGISIKFSLFLWGIPTVGMYLLLQEKKHAIENLSKEYVFFGVSASFPLAVTFGAVKYLPSLPIFGVSSFIAISILAFGVLRFLLRHEATVQKLIVIILGKKILLIGSLLALVVLSTVTVYVTGLHSYAKEFLTNARLLFEKGMYTYLNRRLTELTMKNLLGLGVVGSVALLWTQSRSRLTKFLLSFLVGTVCYFILASKSIYFHTYYYLVFVVYIIFAASYVFALTFRMLPRLFSIIALGIFSIFFVQKSIGYTQEFLSIQNRSASQVMRYLQDTLKSEELYLVDEDAYLQAALVISTKRVLGNKVVGSEEFANDLQETDLYTSLQKNHIRYFLTSKYTPTNIDAGFLQLVQELYITEGRKLERSQQILLHREFAPLNPETVMKISQSYGRITHVKDVGEYHVYDLLGE